MTFHTLKFGRRALILHFLQIFCIDRKVNLSFKFSESENGLPEALFSINFRLNLRQFCILLLGRFSRFQKLTAKLNRVIIVHLFSHQMMIVNYSSVMHEEF